MKKFKSQDLLAIFILAVFLLVFFFPVLFGGRTFVTTGVVMSDLMNQNYPFKVVYSQMLESGQFPFWVSKMGNGFPLVAEGQVGAFYPLNIVLFYLLPTLLAFNLSLFLHYFLAGFFVYLLARSWLKFSVWPALLSGLSFALSGFMVIHLVHLSMVQTVVWFPLQLLLLEKLLKKPKLWQGLVLGLVFGIQFLAGHPELFFFSAMFLAIYFLFKLFTSSKEISKNWFKIGLFLVLGVVITLVLSTPQLLESWQMIGFSNRSTGMSYQEATSYLFPLRHFLTWVIPWAFDFVKESTPAAGAADMTNLWETYLYLGLLPFGLAIWAAILLVKGKSKSRLLLGVVIFSIILALGRSTPVFKLFWNLIPGIKLFKYPTRFLVFTAFSLSLLGGWGMEITISKIKSHPSSTKSTRGRGKSKMLVAGVVILIVFLDLWFFQGRINPTMKASDWFLEPKTAEFLSNNLGNGRFYTLGTSNIDYASIKDLEAQKSLRELLPGDFNLIYGLRSANEQAAFFLDRHTMLTKSAPGTRLSFDPNGSFKVPDGLIKTLSLRAVKYVLSPLPLGTKGPSFRAWKEVALSGEPVDFLAHQPMGGKIETTRIPVTKIYLYENTQVLPRARMVYQAHVCQDCSEEELLTIIVSPDFKIKEEALLEEELDQELTEDGQGEVEFIEDEDLRVKLRVNSKGNGLLVLADNYYPAWQVTLDGEPAKIYLANFAYRGVIVPDGEHEVEFEYQALGIRYWVLGTRD
ncbi:YfhO family protein [Patescibacteria group bacterium]